MIDQSPAHKMEAFKPKCVNPEKIPIKEVPDINMLRTYDFTNIYIKSTVSKFKKNDIKAFILKIWIMTSTSHDCIFGRLNLIQIIATEEAKNVLTQYIAL